MGRATPAERLLTGADGSDTVLSRRDCILLLHRMSQKILCGTEPVGSKVRAAVVVQAVPSRPPK
jgi:hypothetical protein